MGREGKIVGSGFSFRNTSNEPDTIIKNAMKDILLAMFLNQLLMNTATLLDALIVSRFYGDVAMGGCGITYNLVFMNVTLGSIFAVGAYLECASAMSAGEQKRANVIFSASIYLALVFSVALTVIGMCLSGPAATFFGAAPSAPELHEVTAEYIRGLSYGFPADYLAAFLSAIMLLDGSKMRILWSAVVMILVNVLCNLGNVFFLQWDMFGIGLATAFGNYCALGVLLLHFASPAHRFRLVKPEKLLYWLGVFYDRSASSLLGRVMKWLYFMLFVHTVIMLASSDSLISYSAFNNFRNIMICICLGLGSASLLLSGVMYSEKNVRALRQTVRTGLKLSLLLGAGIGGTVALFAEPILSVYGLGEHAGEAVLILRIYGFFFFIEFLKFYYSFYTRAIYKWGISTFYNIFGEFLFPTLSALVLGVLFGSVGIWFSIPVGSALAVLSVVLYSLKKNGSTGSFRDDLMLLPPAFFEGQDTCLNVSPRKTEDIILYSEAAERFLLERGYGDRIAHHVALSIEELLLNIQNRAGETRNTDLFVRIEDEQIILRIRCDGKLLNPLSIQDIYDEKTEEIYGPALIQRIADSMEYNTAMGLNNLIVRFQATPAGTV